MLPTVKLRGLFCRRIAQAAGLISLMVTLAACGETPAAGGNGPEPARIPISLTCVERVARGERFVAAVETAVPKSGPAAGASRYVNVRFKRGGSLAVSGWPSEATAGAAADKYQRLRPPLSLAISETKPTILEAFRDAEIRDFKSCGIG